METRGRFSCLLFSQWKRGEPSPCFQKKDEWLLGYLSFLPILIEQNLKKDE